jgi:hypothetical protein
LDLKAGFDVEVEIRNSQESARFTIEDVKVD